MLTSTDSSESGAQSSERLEPRPGVLPSTSFKIKTDNCGVIYLHITYKDERPFEIFVNMGKSGACQNCLMRGITRLASAALRAGVPMEVIHKQFSSLHCGFPTYHEGKLYPSCLALIARQIAVPVSGRRHS